MRDRVPTMLWTRVGDVLVVAHGEDEPSDADWSEWVQHAARERAASGRSEDRRAFFVTDGPGPNARHRRLLMQTLPQPEDVPVAVVSGSAAVRAINTAFAWIGKRNLRSFRPGQVDAALDYLGVPDAHRADLLRAAATLRVRLAGGNDVEDVRSRMHAGATVLEAIGVILATRLADLRAKIAVPAPS